MDYFIGRIDGSSKMLLALYCGWTAAAVPQEAVWASCSSSKARPLRSFARELGVAGAVARVIDGTGPSARGLAACAFDAPRPSPELLLDVRLEHERERGRAHELGHRLANVPMCVCVCFFEKNGTGPTGQTPGAH